MHIIAILRFLLLDEINASRADAEIIAKHILSRFPILIFWKYALEIRIDWLFLFVIFTFQKWLFKITYSTTSCYDAFYKRRLIYVTNAHSLNFTTIDEETMSTATLIRHRYSLLSSAVPSLSHLFLNFPFIISHTQYRIHLLIITRTGFISFHVYLPIYDILIPEAKYRHSVPYLRRSTFIFY